MMQMKKPDIAELERAVHRNSFSERGESASRVA
jgi:hypothetical protein